MEILVSGSSGLLGSVLIPALEAGRHRVTRLVRRAPRAGGENAELSWNPRAGMLDGHSLSGMDAVIHLAGETISERWTAEKKKRIRESRVQGTGLLAERMAAVDRKPRVLICASAVGYYGDRGEERLNERSGSGSGFLAEVCREWEAAAKPASENGIRTVFLRMGVVLSRSGGALAKMLPPFRLGVGGKIGSGRQYMSWIAIDDVVGAALHALNTESLSGAVNAVAPNPATNAEFTRALGESLHRPTIFPLPALAVRLAFGEMGQELLLSSARVYPDMLLQAGYRFQYAELLPALRHALGAEGLRPPLAL